MSEESGFTLQQIAQIALGGTTFRHSSISLLHTIINIALKKLDCEHEKVTISGVPAENLRKLLKKSTKGPALQLDEDSVKAPMKDYRRLDELEEKVKILERSLDEHLASVKFRITSGEYVVSQPCLTEIEVEEEKDETIKSLLKNNFLTKELKERLSRPLVCRMNVLEIKLREICADIETFKNDCADAHVRMDKMEEISDKLKAINKEVSVNNMLLDKTMLEVQQSMDFKVNNCDIIPFKDVFKRKFDILKKKVKATIERETKSRALISLIEPSPSDKSANWALMDDEKESKTKAIPCGCDEWRYENVDHSLRLSVESIPRRSSERFKVIIIEESVIDK